MKKLFYFILILSAGMISACKKDKGPGKNNIPGKPTNPNDTALTKFELTQDSIYLYAKEVYYWNNSLPDYNAFNPRQYTVGSTDLDKFTSEIDAYTQLSKNPANHNLPYEYDFFNPGSSKYSFIDDGEVDGELNATKGDFGLNYFYNSYTDIRVSLVYPNSPADEAGLKRGDEILAVNNNKNIYITNIEDPANDPGYRFVSNALNQGSTVTLQIRNPSGTKTVTLNSKTYTVNPIIYTNTYTLKNGRVAGYLVFNSFVSNIHAQLDAVFSNFAANHVTDLIIDLRYNGGGDVETSSYLSNLIAPSSVSGSVMNTTYWTTNLQNDNYPLLKKKIGTKPAGWFKPTYPDQIEKFSKAGAVNVNRVFFLITGNTASASELTINNLKPKMDVQLIGDTTYGKPVGFLSKLTINGHYLYTPEFETKNSAQEGGYYAGMPPNGTTAMGGVYKGKQIYEDIVTDFGDKNETLLHQAIGYIETNAYPASSTLTIQSLSTSGGRPMSLYQRRVLSAKTQPNRTNSMFINLK